ncbi:sugar-binding domain-containing protein [uncultured Clostridium sp.]|uniref:sugar-binding transcriptional regulator n=1 Tax=uncultured Clostridium sp. TaxID=59620 RepID=UPI0032167D33
MEKLLKLQQKVVPELLEVLDVRYIILKNIKYREPIGRRVLSTIVNLSERVVRSETNLLKAQGLIDIKSSGMYITEEGNEVFVGLKAFMKELSGLNFIEEELKKLLKVREVIVINGNVAEDSTLYTELGRVAANYLKSIIKDDIIISLTGGRTVKEVIYNFTPMTKYKNIKVLPGRGGMGKETEIQSNTLVEILANKLDGTYELLHIPDNISSDSFKALIKESDIKETFKHIEKSNVLIHGIGLAKEMCDKRSLCNDVKDRILELGAIGEAYGHYFNSKGEVVYSMTSIGITKDRIESIPNVIAVAAGIEKAEAIMAIQMGKVNSTLVTDEATAKEILKLF